MAALNTLSALGAAVFFMLASQVSSAALPEDAVRVIKGATVYVRIGAAGAAQSGSGFLVHRDGARALVATNAHVVADAGGRKPHIIFHSGTRRERTVRGRLSVLDRASDLAILEIEAADLPVPMKLDAVDRVTETQELYIAGFPFGEALATNRTTPTLTLGRGTVSSLKLDINDRPKLIQVDGDINPGNSGGPVLDVTGRVIGISVSMVRETNIGFAVPVRALHRLLGGTIGNLRVVRGPDRVHVVGDVLDPLRRLKRANLVFGDSNKARPRPLQRGDRWDVPLGPTTLAPFEIGQSGLAIAEIPLASGESPESWIAQLVIDAGQGEQVFEPLKISLGELNARIEGPGALAAGERRETLADLERTDAESADELIVRRLLEDSGLNRFINAVTEDPALFFANRRKKAADDEKQKDMERRFAEVMGVSWDRDRLHRHYSDTFLAELDRRKAAGMSELLRVPGARDMHVDFVTLTTQGDEIRRDILNAFRKRDPAFAKRRELLKRIDAARGLSVTLNATIHTSTLSVATVLNDLQPTGRRMDTETLERDLDYRMTSQRAQVALGVEVLLAQIYRDRDDTRLAEYAELVESDAFRWFTDRETAAFISMVTLRFAAAESELSDIFADARRDAAGVEEVTIDQEMSPEEMVQQTLDAYGVELAVKYLLGHSDGQVTIEKDGSLGLTYGRPRKDFITPKSVLADLARFDIEVASFVEAMDTAAVEAGIHAKKLERDTKIAERIGKTKRRRASSRKKYSSSSRSRSSKTPTNRTIRSYCNEGCYREAQACSRISAGQSTSCHRRFRSCLTACR